jgi:hypothetical protein
MLLDALNELRERIPCDGPASLLHDCPEFVRFYLKASAQLAWLWRDDDLFDLFHRPLEG